MTARFRSFVGADGVVGNLNNVFREVVNVRCDDQSSSVRYHTDTHQIVVEGGAAAEVGELL